MKSLNVKESLDLQPLNLSAPAKVFIGILTLNGVANHLSSIFIYVYLFRLSQNFYEVALFNFISYLIWLPAFITAGWLSKKIDRKKGIVIGVMVQLVFYLLLLIFGETSSSKIVILGLIFGVGSGFYWLSVNVLSVDLTNHLNRDWFNGVNGVFSATSQMIGPIVAGWIFTLKPGFTGYKIIFTLSFILFLMSVILTLLLPQYKGESEFNWRELWNIYGNAKWRNLSYIYSSLAFRDGVLSFIIFLWVYVVTESESVLGNYVVFTTSLSVITYYLLGKFLKEKNKRVSIIVGTIGLSLAVFGLVINVNFPTLLIYGIAAGICIPLFEVPLNTLSLNSIVQFDKTGRRRIELVVSREIALSFGRIPSVGGLMLLYTIEKHQNIYIALFMILVICAGLVSLYFLHDQKV